MLLDPWLAELSVDWVFELPPPPIQPAETTMPRRIKIKNNVLTFFIPIPPYKPAKEKKACNLRLN